MGDENAAFDKNTDNEKTSAKRIKYILSHNGHKGEKGSEPVNGEEKEIDADNSP